GLAALWTWAHKQDLVSKHIVQQVDRPKPQRRAIEPYTEKDIRSMLQALGRSRLYTRPRKRSSQHSTQYADRHRAIILLLLDTGIRSSEICQLRIHQVDLRNRTIKVLGKGNKERQIPISSRTSQSLWKYLATRKDDDMGGHLFITSTGRGLDSGQLIRILRRIGARAGVDHVTTHRFRHTFAINFLRNGGDVYSLQMLLGHTSLEMVRRYLAIAQADVQRAHQQASPVDNWRL
ncbi:MAG: tyrosine-type recombinase/integrase, partial [Anaerolineales bacterium]